MEHNPQPADKTKSLNGLSSSQASELLKQYGPNEISEQKSSYIKKLAHWLSSPMSILLIAAAALSFYSHKTFDGWFILFLFVLNFIIAQWHEAKADKAIATLQKKLTVNIQVLRDGKWQLLPSTQLVPNDIVKLGVGNIIPADIKILECKNLSVNESVLTGESLPQEKDIGALCYSGSFITEGNLDGVVESTGGNTKFGKTVTMVDTKPKNSELEKDILTISKYLMLLSIIGGVIITADLLINHQSFRDLLRLDLSILIAGVPVAMPTVMSLIISLGVVELTKKHVIVRRLSSLEDFANVDLLLSDKTGTLTQNEIQIETIKVYGNFTENQLISFAASATNDNQLDPINQAVLALAASHKVSPLKQVDFTPADSKRKRSTAIVASGGEQWVVSMGAPQILESLCKLDQKTKNKFEQDVKDAAGGGYRSLAVAVGHHQTESNLELVGLLMLSDTLRPDAESVIRFMTENGIEVKMVTGDNRAIAARVAERLGLKGQVLAAAGKTSSLTTAIINKTGVFAEVLPDDKFRIVQAAAKDHVVASTGDGVNDLPALKKASVGIAVKNAVDALKNAADIVLMTNGISVIRDAIIEARKIFMRTYYYSVYRISESSRLIISIVILSVWYGSFPLTPIQIILLALLNDLPIISLAYDRVLASSRPETINVKRRFELATLLGTIGVATSISFFFLLHDIMHLRPSVVQTMFFLKLAVSGHMLIYVAHTRNRWWKWLPAKQVILATSLTQLVATIIALSGILFQAINFREALLVWAWAFAWMQVADIAKVAFQKNRPIQ